MSTAALAEPDPSAPIASDGEPSSATPIHYLSYATIPTRTANSLQVMQMCAAFARIGRSVTLYARRPEAARSDAFRYYGVERDFELRDVHLRRVPAATRLLYGLWVARQLRGEARFVYGRDFYTMALLAALGARHRLVLEVHQPPGNELEQRLQARVLASPQFERLVVISEALGHEYERRFGARLDGRLLLSRDAAVAPSERPAVPTARSGRLRLGYVGSLSRGKGLGLIAELAARLPECDFHIVGGGGESELPWRGEAPPENVVLHGYVRPENVSTLLSGFDVMLAPYQSQVLVGPKQVDVGAWMSPLKVFEAMAHAKPVVASDLPVLREFLDHDVNALLAAPGDPEAWVGAIRRLAGDDALRIRLSERALREYETHYTWDVRARTVLAGLGEG